MLDDEDLACVVTPEMAKQRLLGIERQLAARFGVDPSNVREHLLRLDLANKLVEDELVADWHEALSSHVSDLPSIDTLRALCVTFETLELAGHALTHVNGPIGGHSTYWCEGCGALVVTYQGEPVLFQGPSGANTTTWHCAEPGEGDLALASKLQELAHASIERLGDIE